MSRSLFTVTGAAGMVLVLLGLGAAFVGRLPFWYIPFTAGWFLLADALSERFAGRSTVGLLLRGEWRVVAIIYVLLAAISWVADYPYARVIGRVWDYPAYKGWVNVWEPGLVEYPFVLLAAQSTFSVLRALLRPPLRPVPLPPWWGVVCALAVMVSFVGPIVNYLWNENRAVTEVLLVALLVCTVAIDGLRHLLTGRSLISELPAGGWRLGVPLIATYVLAVVASEIPNLFAHEWVYLTTPFGMPLWLMLVLMWPSMIVAPITFYELVLDWNRMRGSLQTAGKGLAQIARP